ncbi:hypothetical protein AWB91_26695 [Mycobacterium paraense]|jgi:hypothetical protein|uniref:Uncharacterized protein n=1 Tax=Mycobacterium paraense TaxID=767916 RepID=A0A1X2AID4_9MYCO|nr:hypothetical protein [Mycobacterium paraense]MCV7445262.1 hypothetical protein [Mycobacterium paraense]ORW28236.1 hypothetical protein AWB91_26695 [Mycobacterium paraense]ORW34963.1 hypothetical protein AWB88_02275 [Mycobacterium paraense]ORW39668.1 hypothetical protein AWB89_22450 [Mycobacterium paraense]ORW51135.1 hypothetical protein AWB90_05460 [Mycobacterium paraense]
MKTLIAAGALALAGLMTTAVGIAHADEVEAEGNYSSQAGCLADGAHVELAYNDHLYTHYDCRMGPDGFWHVWLSN